MRKKVQKRGSSRMKELGYRHVGLWIHNHELSMMQCEAKRLGMPWKSFILAALREATYGLYRVKK